MKRTIREKAKRKSASHTIFIVDSAFVLRILLEYYRAERRNRYKLIKMALQANSIGSGGSKYVSFKLFRKVIQTNFIGTSDLEVATLFRDSFAVG